MKIVKQLSWKKVKRRYLIKFKRLDNIVSNDLVGFSDYPLLTNTGEKVVIECLRCLPIATLPLEYAVYKLK